MRRLPLLLLILVACKKEPPASGLPPAAEWQAGSAPAAPADPAPANPHGDTPANPHGDSPPPMPTAERTAPQQLESTADGRSAMGPFTFVVPKEWTVKPTTSSMRAAQFELSAKPGEEADLVVYYFGEGGAGGVEANLERWLGQISQADGKPTKDKAKIDKTKVAGQDATIVTVTGRYQTTQMPGGPPPADMPDGALIGAIVGSPKGPYYFKLTGHKKTVDANAARFKALLASMKLK
ncbi:MAG: hypothetical protein ABI867_08720 [Kofleriaceae bacterium]